MTPVWTPNPSLVTVTSQLYGEGTTLAHGDLTSIGGANPGIIRDQKNSVWHIVYSIWGNGIAYTKSTDLYRWDQPVVFRKDDSKPNSKYPTLVGGEADTFTSDGTAAMLFGADNQVAWGRALWSVEVDFGGSGIRSNTTQPGNSTLSSASSQPSSSLCSTSGAAGASSTSSHSRHSSHRARPTKRTKMTTGV